MGTTSRYGSATVGWTRRSRQVSHSYVSHMSLMSHPMLHPNATPHVFRNDRTPPLFLTSSSGSRLKGAAAAPTRRMRRERVHGWRLNVPRHLSSSVAFLSSPPLSVSFFPRATGDVRILLVLVVHAGYTRAARSRLAPLADAR